MLEKDTYKTIAMPAEGLFKDKGSKFMAFAYPVNSESLALQKLEHLRKQYHDARHHCFAYMLGFHKDYQRDNDDGEPSGSAGKPILGQILSKDLTNIIIVVVRYFGGTLLGVGGLIQAYKTAASQALENAEIITNTINRSYRVTFGYENMSEIMRIIRSSEPENVTYDFREICNIQFDVRLSAANTIIHQLEILDNVEIRTLTEK